MSPVSSVGGKQPILSPVCQDKQENRAFIQNTRGKGGGVKLDGVGLVDFSPSTFVKTEHTGDTKSLDPCG